MQALILKPKEDRRIYNGHLWVFSNEVARHPANSGPGDVVEVISHRGEVLGSALYHPHSLISARLLGRGVTTVDAAFFGERLARALRLRQSLFPNESCYRLVHGESDDLPGLIVDRFGPDLAVQTLSAGMDVRLPLIVESLRELLAPRSIVERNDTALRSYEELPERTGLLWGDAPPEVTIEENQVHYTINLLSGQKTGFFLDQKVNRRAAAQFAPGRNVLDCFCNAGGFGLNAARAGAASVLGVDVSGEMVEQATANAALNGFGQTSWVQADVFLFLEQAIERGENYDVVILDPPSFTRNRKTVPSAKKGYRRLNELACRVLRPEGILVTASCSFHIFEDVFYQIVSEAATRASRKLRLLEQRHQAPDHPVLPAMPETRYLKLGIFQVL
ncbi:MAG: class I SAM-dependent rRNA methyltransferase [Acidobacteria bacterium]|nr:MAG: class I SAM-dependent rRNA methyltransferase [Acidobacteriota bacterium]